jgi:hypothetical protein
VKALDPIVPIAGGEHAVDAVELAAARLGVGVRAGENRRRVTLAALPADEEVADRVEPAAEAEALRPGDEATPRLIVVAVEREAPDAAGRGRAEKRHLHVALP